MCDWKLNNKWPLTLVDLTLTPILPLKPSSDILSHRTPFRPCKMKTVLLPEAPEDLSFSFYNLPY